jgi:hypothetical protein
MSAATAIQLSANAASIAFFFTVDNCPLALTGRSSGPTQISKIPYLVSEVRVADTRRELSNELE